MNRSGGLFVFYAYLHLRNIDDKMNEDTKIIIVFPIP